MSWDSTSSNDMNQSNKSGGDAVGTGMGGHAHSGAHAHGGGNEANAGSDATGMAGGDATDNTSIGSINISS